jgi:hypothetical protein
MADMALDSEDEPQYPCGLCLYLDGDVLAKLGIHDVTQYSIGSTLPLDVIARVVGVSQREGYDGELRECLDLQITDLGIETEPDKDAKPVRKSVGSTLYGTED